LILSALLAVAQEPTPDQLLAAAIDAQQHGDYPTAISDYRKALELRPNMVEAKVNLGAALVHVGEFDGAIAMYKSALPLLIQNNASQKNAVLRNLALAYYKKGDFTNAAEQFETLHKSLPNDVGIAVLLGYSDVRLGKTVAAVALLEPLESRNAANLDDMTPELCAHVAELLFEAGAVDVWWTPVVMKKSRPAFVLSLLAPPDRQGPLSELVLRETTTLGVRRRQEARETLARRWENVRTEWGEVRIKIASMNGTVTNYAPEYEDCRRIAAEHRVPLKTVMQEAARQYLDRNEKK